MLSFHGAIAGHMLFQIGSSAETAAAKGAPVKVVCVFFSERGIFHNGIAQLVSIRIRSRCLISLYKNSTQRGAKPVNYERIL
jgi:hypothetical protein